MDADRTAGDFDLGVVAGRVDAWIGEGHDRLLFDLESVRYLTSSAFGFFLRIKRVVEERGGGLFLLRPQPFVMRTIQTIGLDEVLTIVEDSAEVAGLLDEAKEGRALRIDPTRLP